MAKTGRPLAGDAVREIPVTFRVTQAEYRWLQSLSYKHGRSVSDVVRFLTLAGMPRETPAESSPAGADSLDPFLARHPWGE